MTTRQTFIMRSATLLWIASNCLTAPALPAAERIVPVVATIPCHSEQGRTTTSTNFVDALSVTADVPYSASVLVLASFCLDGGNGGAGDVFWRLTDGIQTSVPMLRYLSGGNDQGNATATHIFTNVNAGARTFTLQHASSIEGKSSTIYGANMVALPLVTDQGSILASSLATMTSTSSVATTNFAGVGLSTTVRVDRVSNSNTLFLNSNIAAIP